MTYTISNHGDPFEQLAWSSFLEREFPSYERFWQQHIVPLTNRPLDIQLKSDVELSALGKGPEDVAIAQLHYTVLKHLFRARQIRESGPSDDFALFIGLSALVGSQDVAFEVLQRCTNRGQYDPWLESRSRGGARGGQDAQKDWKKSNGYPLQAIRDYRNKLIHGRTPPALVTLSGGMMMPTFGVVDKYCDWRRVTAAGAPQQIAWQDFEAPSAILAKAWQDTVHYLETTWQRVLV